MYLLIEPLEGGQVGKVKKIFSSYEESVLWCEENCTNPIYDGWYVTTENELNHLN